MFARLLYNRLEPILDQEQPPQQAGFRRKFSTDDHLFTDEWQLPLWTATLDFKKAFDTVSHTALWNALAAQNVPGNYITLITKLYADQTGTVHTDKASREFNIQRGTKQGDPLSSLLFNALSEHIFRRCQPTWERRDYGLELSSGCRRLTDLRFADDVILFGTSLRQVSALLTDIQREALATGLELHPDKTKILHNQRQRRTRRKPDIANINNLQIEILPYTESQKYLGRKFTFDQPHDAEVDSRIAAGWRKFHVWKQELTTRTYSLLGRLRLFNGTVTPTVLYGCSSWTMTTERHNRLRRVQRQMLRMILGSPRRQIAQTTPAPQHDAPTSTDSTDSTKSTATDDEATAEQPREDLTLEPWAVWVKRTTHEAERHLARLNIQDWSTIQKQRKEQLFHTIAQETHKWTHRALHWDPETTHQHARRRAGHPKTRWTDDFTRLISNEDSLPEQHAPTHHPSRTINRNSPRLGMTGRTY